MALHGNWVAIDAPGRVMLAQALFCNFGGGRELPYPDVAALVHARGARARLALGPGDAARPAAQRRRRRRPRAQPARRATATRCGSSSTGEDAALLGETVERRLKTLAPSWRCGLKSPFERRADAALRSAAGEAFDPVLRVEMDVQPVAR